MASYLKIMTDCLEKYGDLSDEDFGRLMRKALSYVVKGEDSPGSGVDRTVWKCLRTDIDAERERLRAISEKRSKAGKAGMSSRWEAKPLKQEQASDTYRKFADGDDDLLRELHAFEEMRDARGCATTERMRELLVERLRSLAGSKHEMVLILRQSIEGGWSSIQPLKSGKAYTGKADTASTKPPDLELRAIQRMLSEGTIPQ